MGSREMRKAGRKQKTGDPGDRRGRTGSGRILGAYLGLLAALALAVLVSAALGTVRIDPVSLPSILFAGGGTAQERAILFDLRLPRLLMALILGGALAASGFLLQTYFQNPIAGPFVLGISSGAKFMVALSMILALSRRGRYGSSILISSAFAGALATTGLLILVGRVMRGRGALLVAGMMIGYIASAGTDFLITFADDADIVNLRSWSMGSFSGMDWSGVRVAATLVGAVMAVALLLSKPIGAFRLGETYASSLGVRVGRYRMLLILMSSLLSAVVTAYAGPVSFVGIAVPFLMRTVTGTSKPSQVLPLSFLGGAVFCLYADLIARLAFSPMELNISTVTSLFGAPVVIIMLVRRRGEDR